MKNNHQPNQRQWDPASRALWLQRHGAPANMRLVTDLELHVIAQGLEAERKKALFHEVDAKKAREERDQLRAEVNNWIHLNSEQMKAGLREAEERARLEAVAYRLKETIDKTEELLGGLKQGEGYWDMVRRVVERAARAETAEAEQLKLDARMRAAVLAEAQTLPKP